jgi:hypothetical protein
LGRVSAWAGGVKEPFRQSTAARAMRGRIGFIGDFVVGEASMKVGQLARVDAGVGGVSDQPSTLPISRVLARRASMCEEEKGGERLFDHNVFVDGRRSALISPPAVHSAAFLEVTPCLSLKKGELAVSYQSDIGWRE